MAKFGIDDDELICCNIMATSKFGMAMHFYFFFIFSKFPRNELAYS